MEPLLILLLLVALGWLWLDNRRAYEIALAICKYACESKGLQLLDATVVLKNSRMKRDTAGRLRIRRMYTFEYSTDRVSRRQGYIVMHGIEMEALQLNGNDAVN